jgi:antitoxin VapB
MRRMSLYIRNPETDRLARELAARMGTSITEAITSALRDQIARTAAPMTREEKMARIRELQRQSAMDPILDPRHPDDILYDSDGLPK